MLPACGEAVDGVMLFINLFSMRCLGGMFVALIC